MNAVDRVQSSLREGRLYKGGFCVLDPLNCLSCEIYLAFTIFLGSGIGICLLFAGKFGPIHLGLICIFLSANVASYAFFINRCTAGQKIRGELARLTNYNPILSSEDVYDIVKKFKDIIAGRFSIVNPGFHRYSFCAV